MEMRTLKKTGEVEKWRLWKAEKKKEKQTHEKRHIGKKEEDLVSKS